MKRVRSSREKTPHVPACQSGPDFFSPLILPPKLSKTRIFDIACRTGLCSFSIQTFIEQFLYQTPMIGAGGQKSYCRNHPISIVRLMLRHINKHLIKPRSKKAKSIRPQPLPSITLQTVAELIYNLFFHAGLS